MTRPAEAVINVGNFRSNFLVAKRYAGSARVMAVVKANGYGHGAPILAASIPEADAFGVASLEEALALRKTGVRQPIVLLSGFFADAELSEISSHHFEIVVHSEQQVESLLKTRLPSPLKVWLKLDTGMHRLGLSPAKFAAQYLRLNTSKNVSTIRLLSHFASADSPTDKFNKQQVDLFYSTVLGLKGEISLANSAALISMTVSRADWVRPGIMLYGASPFAEEHPVADRLLPVMTLKSRVVAIRDVPVGESVGYAHIWAAERPSIIGTVAIGYADGYPRHAPSGTPVLVNGRHVPLVGRVSMDLISVDLTNSPTAQVGDEVVLWGEGLPAWELADWADTIAYQLFTGVTRRVAFRYEKS